MMKSYIKPDLNIISVMPEAPIAYGEDIVVNPGDNWDNVSTAGTEYLGYGE